MSLTPRQAEMFPELAATGSDRPLAEDLKRAVRPAMAEVAPGKFVPMAPRGRAPEVALCVWHQNEDGTHTPRPINQRMVRLDRELARLLGFQNGYNTLRRLGRAGYVELIAAAPHCTMINLDSWFNHLRRCAEDPEFWSAQKNNLREYRKAI